MSWCGQENRYLHGSSLYLLFVLQVKEQALTIQKVILIHNKNKPILLLEVFTKVRRKIISGRWQNNDQIKAGN
jgi:hypothetical protein